MKSSPSLTTKLVLFVFFALIFAATMVALSVHNPQFSSDEERFFGTSKNFEKKFAVEPGGLLVLDADAGDIMITGTDNDELSAVVTARGSESILGKFHVDFDQDGNTVRIRGKYDQRFFHFFDNESFEARYEIQLPKHFNLQIGTSGGDLVVRNVEGKNIGETSGGDVSVENISGVVRMTTSGGNVSMINSTGELKLETSGGDIKGESLTGSVDVETSGGNIIIKNSDARLSASTSGGDIRVELKDNKGLRLSTSGGNISVMLPKSISAEVDATTTGGDVSCDFSFQGKIKDGNMRGKINGGGNLIQAETSGGDIDIKSVE